MIVLNNKETTAEKHDKEMHPYVDMFHKELDAYCTYKEWAEETNDPLFERALYEMMEDEYLHAKFLHEYVMERDLYSPDADDEYEKKFWKIHNRMKW
jgi:rubrerythrin